MVLAVWPCAAISEPRVACGAELLIDHGSGDALTMVVEIGVARHS